MLDRWLKPVSRIGCCKHKSHFTSEYKSKSKKFIIFQVLWNMAYNGYVALPSQKSPEFYVTKFSISCWLNIFKTFWTAHFSPKSQYLKLVKCLIFPKEIFLLECICSLKCQYHSCGPQKQNSNNTNEYLLSKFLIFNFGTVMTKKDIKLGRPF
jgi:hypothetical protein